jgi:hypothetical protein
MNPLECPERPVVKMSIWHGSSGPLPNCAQFVCAYEMGFGIDDLPEAVFLVQGETDELWIIRDPPDGLLEMLAAGDELSPLTAMNAVTARHQLDRQRSAAVLLDALFEAGLGFCWPTRHLISGIIDREAFAGIVENLQARIDAREQAARSYADAPIVLAARECRLNLEPSGTSPIAWMARCPGTNHSLMIGADTNTWGCGWCKRKGGPEELKAFVVERRTKR